AEVNRELKASEAKISDGNTGNQATTVLQEILLAAQSDRPFWEDWQTFWKRCQDLVVAIAHIHHPEVKYPLLNIYVPQAYGLIRGTVDDMDQWMQKLSPVLSQLTVGQAYQGYEVYRKLEPSARKLGQVWDWAQWVLNPVVAVAKRASQPSSNQANQQLLFNLSQLLREAALRNLCQQAIALYGGTALPDAFGTSTDSAIPLAKTQTLRDILSQAQPAEVIAQKPLNILLVGRTGAGKSSLINTLFQADLLQRGQVQTEFLTVDILPSTDQIQSYQWQSDGETLILWDTPGYEQVNRSDFREQVLDFGTEADLLLIVTPALDPALQMDVDFLKEMQDLELPTLAIVSQVDRLRPLREWEPPYDWQWGDRPKEIAIREAVEYRAQLLGEFCDRVLPIVTSDSTASDSGRMAWGVEALSLALIEAIAPAKQLRLAHFLRNLDARTIAAAKIIDRYTLQMTTTQGLTLFLKSPVLQFISTLSTGTPALAYVLAQKIPVEQLPVVIGKLQMAYDLFLLLNPKGNPLSFDLRSLWSLLIENSAPTDRAAGALGHALVEYWTQDLTVEQLQERFNYYLNQSA
ncbi:MAG: 50S ribosome-binding GTPase, partial [Cyanobacteria bacterium CAN_BIN43]|nr:50S ribosome-binding GTPase [Cyanobacteria bacterium CAN_BIN43]